MTSDEELADARLAEFNHRVLNSLAMISSIIGMESRAVTSTRSAAQRPAAPVWC